MSNTNHYLYDEDIESNYYLFNISIILILIDKYVKYYNVDMTIDFDNIIHDYLIQLRYQLNHQNATTIITDRLSQSSEDQYLAKGIQVLLDSIYYQMCLSNLYTPGELDYRKVKNNTIHISSWQDQYTPVFKYIDRPNTTHLIELERLSYLYI